MAGKIKLTEASPKYRDFSEMPDDVLRSFANKLAEVGRRKKPAGRASSGKDD